MKNMKLYETFTTEKQWQVYLQNLIDENYKAYKKAVIAIYDRQTDSEKRTKESSEENGAGFSKVDAKEMSAISVKLKHGIELTPGEVAKSKNKIKKYWKQLMLISKSKMREEELKQKGNENEGTSKNKSIFEGYYVPTLEEKRQCYEDGKSCSFGFCQDCILVKGTSNL